MIKKYYFILLLLILIQIIFPILAENNININIYNNNSINNNIYKNCAIVTLIYNHDKGFSLGATTLGYSLLDVQTKATMVAMITKDISYDVQCSLEQAGWLLFETEGIFNPNQQYSARFDYVFTKLQLFNLVQFDRVIYMDADMIALENIDELCTCGGDYCAVVRNTFFNGGLMVLTPSLQTYKDMMTVYHKTHSYEGGDQGFLNNYYWNPELCGFFIDPSSPMVPINNNNENDNSYYLTKSNYYQNQIELNRYNDYTCYRLPGYYNGDVGIFIARNDIWHFDPDEIRSQPKVIHFTLTVFKPWNWLSYIIISCNWQWWNIYSNHHQLHLDQFEFILQCIPLVLYWIIIITYFLNSLFHFNFKKSSSSSSSSSSTTTSFFSLSSITTNSFFLCLDKSLKCFPKLNRCLNFIFTSNTFVKLFFGHLIHFLIILFSIYYSSLTFIHPTINLILYFITYISLCDLIIIKLWFLCLQPYYSYSNPQSSQLSSFQSYHYPQSSISTTTYSLLSPTTSANSFSSSFNNFTTKLSLNYYATVYKVYIILSKALLICILWSYSLFIYGRIISLIIWVIISIGINHTVFLLIQ